MRPYWSCGGRGRRDRISIPRYCRRSPSEWWHPASRRSPHHEHTMAPNRYCSACSWLDSRDSCRRECGSWESADRWCVVGDGHRVGVGPRTAVTARHLIGPQCEGGVVVELEAREYAAAADHSEAVLNALQGIGGVLLQPGGRGYETVRVA